MHRCSETLHSPAVGICRSDCLILIMNVISVLHRQGARVEGSGIRPRYVGEGIDVAEVIDVAWRRQMMS